MPGWLFSPLPPMVVKKITSPPSGVKREGHERKKGMRVRVSKLSAWRLAVKDTGSAVTPLKFLKSSTYNMHFKSYPVLRVLA